MADLAKSRKSLQGALEKCWKNAKNEILQEKSKKTWKMLQDVFFDFWWFWTDSDGFYGSKRAISRFFIALCKNPRILSQILFKTKDFGVNLNFFENFVRNDPKFVFLWKIIILGIT